jgi:hypothetical protein
MLMLGSTSQHAKPHSPARVAVGVGWVVAWARVSNSHDDALLSLAGVGAIHGAAVAIANVGGPASDFIAAAAATCSWNKLQSSSSSSSSSMP